MQNNFTYESLSKKSKAELLELAMEHNVTAYKKMNKSELVDALLTLSQNKSDSQKEKKQASMWSKYSNHIYGLASLIGLVIAIYALNPGGNNAKSTAISTGETITNPDILPAEIRDKNVAVMIFEDETKDEDLSSVGKMISDWITTGLMEINKGKVISAANVRNNVAYAGISQIQNSFAERTGAEVLVQGRYYAVEDQVIIHSDIVDASSGSIIKSMDNVTGQKEDIMELIDELSQRVLGYWATSKSNRYSKKPPKFNAYKAYTIATENWIVNDASAEQKLKEAYEQDNSFYVPLLKLLVLYSNNFRYHEMSPLIQKIEALNPDFSEYEKLRFEAIKAGHEGNLELKAEKYETLAAFDQSSLISAGIHNFSLFKPEKALYYFKQDIKVNKDDNNTWWDQYSEYREGSCLFDLGRHESLEQYFDSLDFKVKNDLYAGLRLQNLVVLQDWVKFDSLVQEYKDISFKYAPAIAYACIYMYIHDIPQLTKYLDDFALANKRYSKTSMLSGRLEHFHALISGNNQTDISYAEEVPSLYFVKVVDLIQKNRLKEAEQEMLNAESTLVEDLPSGDIEYNRAKYHLALGDKELAMEYLKKAFEAGTGNGIINYDNDILLKNLHGYPSFEEFIKPKG